MKYKNWLASLPMLSAAKKNRLSKTGYTLQELYHMPTERLMLAANYADIPLSALEEAQKIDIDKSLEHLQAQQIQLTTITDENYPEKLKHIDNPPFGLYYKGVLPGNKVSISIVGARKCSEYGRATAKKLAGLLAENHIQVISGMATGIDSASHSGALAANGYTVAVLGCGVDICYPPGARPVYEQILKTGCVISEYAPGTKPLPVFFPARNRIISGLSDIVIVVEAKNRSGSLITADFALEQGKDIYAIPGRICDAGSGGTNYLIYQGAGILYDLENFMNEHNLYYKKQGGGSSKKEAQKKIVLEKDEMLLYSCLDFESKYIDSLIEETSMEMFRVFTLLDQLKKKGLVRESYKNYFCRTSF